MQLSDLRRAIFRLSPLQKRDWRQFVAAALTGALLVLAFPKPAFTFLAWVALAPLLWAVTRGAGEKPGVQFWSACGLGWLAGVIFAFLTMNWVAHSMMRYGGFAVWMAYGVVFFFSSILALFPALFAGVTAVLARTFGLWTLALAPTLWVASEWLRGIVTGVTWNQLGVTQARHFAVAQLAQLGGVGLVSWFVAAAASLLMLLANVRTPGVRRAAIVLILCATTLSLPFLISSPDETRENAAQLPPPTVEVVGVQPNIPLDLAATPEEFARQTEAGIENNLALTRRAVNELPTKSADLVVWAESPLVLNYEQDANVRAKLDAVARETKAYLIFSALGREGEKYFNSAQTINPNPAQTAAQPRRYDKMRLVPFGEYVPMRGLLGRFVPTIVGDFTPGTEAVVNTLRLNTDLAVVARPDDNGGPAIERTTRFVRVGTFICYEAAYPNLVRGFVERGATLLVNISDDAWFGATAGPQQHLDHARMRAIENNRDLVRVTNSGISALIKPNGDVVEPLPQFTAAAHAWQAEVRSPKTFYTQHGDWFAKLCAAIGAASLLAAAFVNFKRKSTARP